MEILGIFLITISVSILCFSNLKLFQSLLLSPYKIVHQREWYRCFTYGFVHSGPIHLIFNLLTLFFFYKPLLSFFDQTSGTPITLFFGFYFSVLVLSVIPQIMLNRNNPKYAGIGASGGVVGVVFTVILLHPTTRIGIFIIPPFIPAYIFGFGFLVVSFILAKNKKGGNIDHITHIFGALAGLIILWIYSEFKGFNLIQHFIRQIF